MEIYIKESEMPNRCDSCFCYDLRYGGCNVTGNFVGEEIPSNCPIKTIEQHDKEVIENFSNNNFVYKTTQGNEVNVAKIIKNQAIKEFAERLKEKSQSIVYDSINGLIPLMFVLTKDINELVEEMTK